MVSERNEVITVRKSYYSFCVNFGHWKQMLQNVRQSVADLRIKSIENQMRKRFRDWIYFVFQIMAQNYVAKPKVSSWTIRQVSNN